MGGRQPSAVQIVIAYIKVLGARGLADDLRLPAEDAICAAAGVSRGSVREALKVLEALGAIEIRRGIGTFLVPQGLSALDNLIAFQNGLKQAPPRDIFELRLTLKKAAAGYAAERRSEADLARMTAANEEMRRISESRNVAVDALTRADVGFHIAVYEAAHNPLLATVGRFVTELVAPLIRGTCPARKRAVGGEP